MDRERLASVGKALLVAILIAQVLGLLLVWSGDRGDSDPEVQRPPAQRREPSQNNSGRSAQRPNQPETEPTRFPERYVSEAGYSFRYPRGWTLDASDSVTELTSPEGATKITFGLTPPADLSTTQRRLLDTLEQEYSDVIVTTIGTRPLSGLRARLAEGRATNDFGVRLRFRALIVDGRADHLAVLGFEEAARGTEMRPVAAKIMRTLRPTSRDGGGLSMSSEPVSGGP